MAYHTYEEAAAAVIPAAVALAEISRHGLTAYRDGNALICAMDGDVIAKCDEFGDVSGGAVLAWLGY